MSIGRPLTAGATGWLRTRDLAETSRISYDMHSTQNWTQVRGRGKFLKKEIVDAALAVALERLGPPNVLVGHRVISAGDEHALLAGEIVSFRASGLLARRQSGAARLVARQLLGKLGIDCAELPRSASGAPVWPLGLVGSLAHDRSVAVAAVASADRFGAVGIDIEPAQPLPSELVDMVTTPTERAQYPAEILQSRLLFAIKEATYKAVNPLDHCFLDFHDVTVDLAANQAFIRNGRKINFAVGTGPRIVALAYVEAH